MLRGIIKSIQRSVEAAEDEQFQQMLTEHMSSKGPIKFEESDH